MAPNTPTFAEAGYPDLVVTSWSLWAVPAGTPAKAKEKLQGRRPRSALQAARRHREHEARAASSRQACRSAEADAFIKAEYKRWGEVIRAAGIQPQ